MKTKFKISNRILSLVLALVMVLGMMPMTAYAAADRSAYAPTREENYYNDNDMIFANGTAITIEAAPNGTRVWYMDGTTKVYVTNNGESGEDLSGWYIFAGSTNSDGMSGVNGSITMTGGTVGYIFAGQFYGHFTGTSNITITGGTVKNSIFCDSYYSVSSGDRVGTVTIFDSTGAKINTGNGGKADNVVQKKGTTWSVSGNPNVPAGVTLTVAEGETLTVPANSTLTNNGTIVNNGTITINGAIRNNGSFTNNGTINRNAAYITTAAEGTPTVWLNGSAVSNPVTEYADGKLYVFNLFGNLKVTLNGTDYYGVHQAGSATELTSDYVGVTDFTGIQEQIKANEAVTLNATYSPAATTLSQTISYELVDAGGTGAVLSENTLTTYGAGIVKIRVKATDGYNTYTEDFSINVTFTPVIGVSPELPSTLNPGTHTLPDVAPTDATYRSIEWSVVDAGTTGASISGKKLTIQDVGTLKLQCIVKNGVAYGTDYTKEYTITVKALEYIDISQGSVTITKKDENTVTVAYAPFGGNGTKDYASDEYIAVTGTSTNQYTITIASGEVNLLLNNCHISYNDGSVAQPIYVKSGAVLNLKLAGDNSLTHTSSVTGDAHKNAALRVPAGATLTIDGEGTLTAAGGYYAAGIGGGYGDDGGNITINGGFVTASTSNGGVGIGGGHRGNGGTITVNGGTVTASGSSGGAGIGGGAYGDNGGTITINGGTVTASAYKSAGIGGGSSCKGGIITINGGNIKASSGLGQAIGNGYDGSGVTVSNGNGSNVSKVTLTLNGAAADTAVTAITGMTYGINDVKTLDTDKLYFYIPSGAEATSITAGETIYDCKVGLTYYPGHDYVDATCSLPQTCTRCGHTVGEALGHNYVDGVCSNCGIGEADGIFYISTAEQLMMFAEYVNAGNQSADAVLMADIDLTGYDWTTICETDLYYKAYGTDLGYSGTFDGNGHVIKNITVTSSTTRDASCGLFGTVSGTIKHLGIENFNFVDGGKDIRTGAIVGQLITANGKVSNCYVKNATINPGAHVTGGIAGCVYDGTIENCYVVESTISGSSGRYGHIVGDSIGDGTSGRPGTVTNCYTDNATIRSNNVGNVSNCATKTTDAFASGEVTYLLNGSKSDDEVVWYQTIGTDAYPKFSGSVVYYDSVNGYNNHIHNWTYTKDGNKITATCDAAGCTTPKGGDVTIAVPGSLTYTGNKIEADVENTLTTGATVNVEYSGDTTDGYPVNVGEYTAKITIDGKEISVTYEIAAASIEGASVSASNAVYTGNAQEPAVTVKLGDKTLTEGTDYTVGYSNNTAVGTATVTVTGKGNYAKTATGSFDIAYLTGAPDAAVSGTQGAAGWYTSDVTLTAPDGYTISKTVDGAYGETLTFASEQNETVTYYLKDDASGKIAEKTVELKIDLTPPTAKYEINDDGWRSFIKFISFGIFCKDNADLSITASDTMDESVTVQYVVSTTKLTASEITDWNDYSDKVALNPKAKNYIYIKVTDDAGRTVVYESGVVVFADSTASAEIEYTKHSTEDVTAQIVFNGNTVKEVKNGSTVLTADQYTVTDSGIQFKADYLNTFAAGNYSFVVTYDPVGESWVDSTDGIANATVGTTTIELTVKKAILTITGATLADKTYNGSASGTVTGVTFGETDKLVLGTDYTATVVYDDANAGDRTATVTVTLLKTDKANAYALESDTYTMDATIGKAKAPTLTDVKANYKFTITGFEAEVASVGMPADAGAIAYTEGTASVSGNATVTVWNVDENGKVTATISGGAKQDVITLPVTVSSDNYEDAVVNVVVTLGNRPAQSALTVKADSSVIYGNELALSTEGGSGTGDVTYSIVSGNENATIEGNVLTAAKVGTVVITATKAGDDDYEPATSAQFTIEVTQRELEITGATATDRDFNGTADVTITGIALGNIYTTDDVSVSFNTTGTVSSENKGKYSEVTVSGLSLKGEDAANYKLPESADGKYTVSTEVEISALDISGAEITLGNALTYNGSEQEQTVTGVTKNGLTVTYTVSGNKNTNHGNYELTVIGTGNFTGTQTKTWNIAKRKITVTATAQTITYGKDITAGAFTSTNVVNGHKLDVTLTPSTANVTVSGTITVTVNDITADGTSVIGNYDVSVSSGKLTIQPDLSAISDLTTENVTSADKADIEAVKDMMSKADYANADEETKAAWDAIVANCDTLLDKIKTVADEIKRVTDKTGSYNAGTVNSDDAADLNKLAADIKALTDSKNLTDEERTELTALAETVAALQKVVTDTTAENKRIAEELAKFDKDTVNSDSSDGLAQLLSDIDKQLDSTNLTEAEKKALEDAKTAVTDMQKVIADTAAENDRISNEVDKYSIDTVKSSDEEALNTLLDEIKDQLTSTHLTDEEISELNGDKTAVEDLLAKIKGTDELIDKLTGDVGSYKDETVKSTDRDALEQIIKDAQALIDSGNVTDSEKETLKGVQEDAKALIDVIDDTAEDVKAITDNAASYNDETVKSTDKDELEQVIKDIDALLDGDNLTDAERESLEEIKQTVQDLIDTIDDTADEIKAANDTIGGLDEDTVKSTDKETIEQTIEKIDELLTGDNLTEDERKALEDTKAKAEDLLDAIDDAAKAPATENTEKVKDVTAETVTPEDKTDLENAKADLEKALEDHGDNYTDDEKKAIEDEIKRIDDALEVIGKVEAVEEQINNLPENITKDDTDDVDAAKKAYDGLSDYEKTLIDPEAKKKLDEAIKAAEEANKPADTTSPGTGDNSNIPGLFALMLGSLAAMFAIIFGTKKKKKAEDK